MFTLNGMYRDRRDQAIRGVANLEVALESLYELGVGPDDIAAIVAKSWKKEEKYRYDNRLNEDENFDDPFLDDPRRGQAAELNNNRY
jgi:hypothetical protein